MITLEQIRLLEGKITRAIDLIRVLKDENATLRRGLESAQKRMKELETLVDGFKTDQQEIETVIVRTLHNLDELEETAAARKQEQTGKREPGPAEVRDSRPPRRQPQEEPAAAERPAARDAAPARDPAPPLAQEPQPAKEELDIF